MDSALDSEGRPVCAVCSVPCTTFCGNCHRVYYCSGEHQKENRKMHRSTCFPIRVVQVPGKGRCVLATRAIKPGELILRDEELVCAPNGNVLCTLPEFRPMCLSCFRIMSANLETNYSCSACGWPVCDTDCEKDPRHAHFECPIFAELHLPPFTKATEYDNIKILRALLLAEANPQKWAQLQDLESHEEVRGNLPNCRKRTFETVIFIRNTCGLQHYGYKIINFLVGVFRVNAFGNHGWPLARNGGIAPSGFREGTFLFYWSSLFAHNCIPNTRSFLTQEYVSTHNNNKNDTRFVKHLLATVDIAAGDEIVISYIETRQGTVERRNILRRGYHFDCSCGRCADPTEYGLYFSAVKCQACVKKHGHGFLLPHNSLDSKSVWCCGECRVEVYWEEVFNTLEEVQKAIESVKNEYEEFPENVSQLEQVRAKFVANEKSDGGLVHENNWLIVELEYDIIKHVRDAFLQCYGTTTATDGNVTPEVLQSWREYLATSRAFVEQITGHCLKVAEVLRPGISIFRGCLLFSLAQCKLIQYEQCIKDRCAVDLGEQKADLLQLAESAKQILVIEPEGSEEYRIGTVMHTTILANVRRLEQEHAQVQDSYFLTEK